MSICHNKQYEREFCRLMLKKGYHCERIAGSGKADSAICDCILFANGNVYVVEVKATKEQKFYELGYVREQLMTLIDTAKKHNVLPLLAIKFKHRGWNTIVPELLENIEYKEGFLL